ncbi:MAG: V-type ATP synthase subunit E family protein [Clostridiales bacterium]|nr:V-type ATP synthase subunit E family protein [Clostridiales bacterium]
MSLERIIEKIIADAQAEAEKIVFESRQKAEAIKRAAYEEASERAAAYQKNAEREAMLEASRIVTQARLEKKLNILRQKKDLLEEVLKKALDDDSLRDKTLTKKVILKGGEQEEALDRERLIEELRPKLENDILRALKI